MLSIHVLTLFPDMFPGTLGFSLAGRALKEGKWACHTTNIREFAQDKHTSVDDKPFGGGRGMVMRPDVVGSALEHVLEPLPQHPVVYLSPRGKTFTQSMAYEWSQQENLTLLCGRFEGVDQRVLDAYNVTELSIGDFILSGGELAALTVMDACIRLLPGVITHEDALNEESFGQSDDYAGLLEYPHYTRPSIWNDRQVPDVLLSGHHAKVKAWRLEQAEAITKERRRDLWERYAAKRNND